MKRIASQRWDVIDVARGVAICAMIIYHFSWDLSYLKLIAANIVQDPAWRWFARSIAGSFLILAGVGLALAHAHGFRRTAFLKRLLKIGGSAALITVATFFAFPESYIFFGILHCIALSSLLALPFLRLPWWSTLAIAVFCFAAPFVFTDPVWDQPWLDWLGLGSSDPVTNDYVPVFPWLGLVLVGVTIGKALLVRREVLGVARWHGKATIFRALIWAGRKSLPIYLVHQVVLFGALYGVLQITGPNPAAEARPFMAQCEASCIQVNGNARVCRATCACVADGLRRGGLWQSVLDDDVDQDKQTRISRIAQQCLKSTPP